MGKSESNRQENPSLAAALLGMSPEAFLNDWQTFSLVFENLCMRDLSAYARSRASWRLKGRNWSGGSR